MKRSGQKRLPALLGLVFEARKVHIAQVVRVKETFETRTAEVLACDPIDGDPLVEGRALRAHLDRAGLKERRCIASMPSDWIMTVQSAVPKLPADDVDSFLQLEAERGFPCELEELQIARSSQQVGTATFVTQLGVRVADVTRLADLLVAAGLKPVAVTIGLTTLPGAIPTEGDGLATLSLSENPPALLLAAGGGIVALRAIASSPEESAAIARALRISLEETPAALRALVRRLRIYGNAREVATFTALVTPWAKAAGIRIETDGAAPEATAVALAKTGLTGKAAPLDLLPPRPSRWQQVLRRYNSRRLGAAIAIAAAAVVVLVGAFAWREYESWKLRGEWARMKPQVDVLDGVQARIREFRPWHDTSFRTLNVLRVITEVFPENGSVTAKSFELRNQTTVKVTGITRDNTALLESLENLRKRSEVTNLKIEQIRGKSPAQFTFSFHVARTPGT